jgi:spore germination cell wall hydrolase CwlJ-like protein
MAAVSACLLAACSAAPHDPMPGRQAQRAARDLSEAGLQRWAATFPTATRRLAERHDHRRKLDYWGRAQGWATYDLARLPSLGFGTTTDETARTINALKPFARTPINPMSPFVLRSSGEDRARALRCLTQAVYYEAGREPADGQAAVAQTVLNRVRHPAYPKSVCAVVFQGSARSTGCQFTFTCDGSLAWAPEPDLWGRAQAVASRALQGFVFKPVGPATHYHADYVAPYWAPTLVKLTRVGAHIFYRWTGPWGEPPAFTGRYAGVEAELSPAILAGVDPRTQGEVGAAAASPVVGRTVTLAVAGEVRTYSVADPTAPGGERPRVAGVLQPTRRKPTPEEVRRINESLAAMEAQTPPVQP